MAFELRGMAPLLQVFDMPTAIRFYRDLLGFELIGASGADEHSDWVLLRRSGIELMLNTAYEAPDRPPEPDRARIAGHADTGLFFSCTDLDAVYDHLKAHGVGLERPRVAPYGMRQLYVTDPDGFVLCFQWPADTAAPSVRGSR